MKLAIVLLLISLSCLFEQCTICSCKKVPCGAFQDDQFTSWFPYHAGDTLFLQNNGIMDTVSFSNIDISSSYEANKGCFNNNTTGCNSHSFIYSDQLFSQYNRKCQVTASESLPFGSSTTSKIISMNLYLFSCNATGIADTGLVSPTFHSRYWPSLSVGNKVYTSVQTIQQDTAGSLNYNGPYRVYLAKGIGIIAYENFPDLKLWTKK